MNLMNMKKTLAALATFAVVLGGCRGDDPPGESATDGDTSSTTAATDSGTSTSGATDDSTSTSTSSSTTAPETTDDSNGFLSSSSTTDSNPLPNGSECTADADCQSMHCYMTMFGSVCSECSTDDDCLEAGTGISCSLDAGSMQAVCTEGGLGTTCESQESCADDLICDQVVQTGGLLPSTCGECGDSNDCDGDLICSPKFDFMALSGYKSCVEPGSVPNDELCPTAADGNDACMSGKCGTVTVMGIIPVGVCGECLSDADCDGGTCVPGEVGQGGIQGAVCG
ncbi:MAG: hypothetical protein R3A79_04770 [Nannocystaceae bacterium]